MTTMREKLDKMILTIRQFSKEHGKNMISIEGLAWIMDLHSLTLRGYGKLIADHYEGISYDDRTKTFHILSKSDQDQE